MFRSVMLKAFFDDKRTIELPGLSSNMPSLLSNSLSNLYGPYIFRMIFATADFLLFLYF